MAEKFTFFTPVGHARFPKLTTPDVFTDDDGNKGPPTYSTGIRYDDPKDWEFLQKKEKEAIAALVPKGKKVKGTFLRNNQEKVNADDSVEFEQWFQAKSIATKKDRNGNVIPGAIKDRPLAVDAKNRPIASDVEIGGGSLIRLEVSVSYRNGYLTAYINGIQVAKLVQGGGSNFGALEGYDEDEEDSLSEGDEDSSDAGDDLDI